MIIKYKHHGGKQTYNTQFLPLCINLTKNNSNIILQSFVQKWSVKKRNVEKENDAFTEFEKVATNIKDASDT